MYGSYYPGGYYYGNSVSSLLYFALLVAMLFSFYASSRVNRTYRNLSSVHTRRGFTGAQAARRILDRHGLTDVTLREIPGELTDHYDPSDRSISLSSDVYYGTSAVAIGVACHEVGHAIQYAEGYFPAKARMAIIPVTNFGSKLAFPLIIAGLLLSQFSSVLYELVYVGIACFALSTLFQLLTLPTEFDASHRALTNLSETGILTEDELPDAKKVLWAAAMTYVAALAVSVLQLLRFIAIYGGRRRRR